VDPEIIAGRNTNSFKKILPLHENADGRLYPEEGPIEVRLRFNG